jgi:hypothetical protein
VREKAMRTVLTLDRALEPILAAILALLDVPEEDAQWQVLDPPQRRRHTLEAVKRLLIRESQGQPVLVARIDRLPPEDKRLLQTAAVIGTEVSGPLLQTMLTRPKKRCTIAWHICRGRSSSTRPVCFTSAPIPSSMP